MRLKEIMLVNELSKFSTSRKLRREGLRSREKGRSGNDRLV